jgi:hypothetical protein
MAQDAVFLAVEIKAHAATGLSPPEDVAQGQL